MLNSYNWRGVRASCCNMFNYLNWWCVVLVDDNSILNREQTRLKTVIEIFRWGRGLFKILVDFLFCIIGRRNILLEESYRTRKYFKCFLTVPDWRTKSHTSQVQTLIFISFHKSKSLSNRFIIQNEIKEWKALNSSQWQRFGSLESIIIKSRRQERKRKGNSKIHSVWQII